METGGEARNILQKVGAAPDIGDSRHDSDEEDFDGARTPSRSIMNMKQESGPFLMPQLWKDAINLNLDNITNDFLESNVTGEVMNLDDFLKELQVNELAQQTEDIQRNAISPQSSASRPSHHLHHQHQQHHHQHQQQQQQEESRAAYNAQSHLRPANIDNLKEHSAHTGQPHSRPSVMHHVGKPPDLHINYQHHSDALNAPPVSLPYREAMQSNLLSSKETHSSMSSGHNIPQASVRPLVRPVIMTAGKQEPEPDIKPPAASKSLSVVHKERMRKMSDCSNFTEDEDDERSGNFGSFTSTVCVNFSEDDLRLATIPGQDFDPATRRFSDEELKPQPIIRKRKKQFVPDELKNNKYWAKRYKNNEAAKRSREARRLKENQIAMRARYLEEENGALKSEVEVLKKENSDLKQMMVALEEKFNKLSSNR